MIDAALVSFLREKPTAEQLIANVSAAAPESTLTPEFQCAIHFTGTFESAEKAQAGLKSAAAEQASIIYGNVFEFDRASMGEAPGDTFIAVEESNKCHIYYVGNVSVTSWVFSAAIVKTNYYLGYFTIVPVELAYHDLKKKIAEQAEYINSLEAEGADQMLEMSTLGHKFRAVDNTVTAIEEENQQLRAALMQSEAVIENQKRLLVQRIGQCRNLLMESTRLRRESDANMDQIVVLNSEINKLKEAAKEQQLPFWHSRAEPLYPPPQIKQPGYEREVVSETSLKPTLSPIQALANISSDLQNFDRSRLRTRDQSEEQRQARREEIMARRREREKCM